MFLVAFPLLIIALAIYNMIAFLTPLDNGWASAIYTIHLPSGQDWAITFGDALIGLALFLLFFEIVKATRAGARSVIDHLLSMLVLTAAVAELALVKQAATSVFAVLTAICLLDVAGGVAISLRFAGRNRAVAHAVLRGTDASAPDQPIHPT